VLVQEFVLLPKYTLQWDKLKFCLVNLTNEGIVMSNDSDIGLYFIIPLSALILLSITNDLIFFQAFFPKRQIIKQWLLWSRSAKKPTPCATWRLLFFKEQSN